MEIIFKDMQHFAWTILPFLYWAMALSLGKDRGYLRHVQAIANDYELDVHPNHAVLNIIVWFLLVIVMQNFFQPFFLLCTFSFWHDGMEYLTREKLKPGTYPKGFFDFTKTPKAFTDKLMGNTGSRVLLAVFGMLCYFGFEFHYVLNLF